MIIKIWGAESNQQAVDDLGTALRSAGIRDFIIEIFPDAVAASWEDSPLMISPLGSFAGMEAIQRAVPYLRPSPERPKVGLAS